MKGSHGENMNILKKGSTALLLFVLLLMALPVFGASPENSAQTVDPAVPGKILIRYRAGADGTLPRSFRRAMRQSRWRALRLPFTGSRRPEVSVK